jgi:DNA repair exonuclease SbcCD ATPase subunit
MTTKDQEREALAKIRTIIEEIGGKDSYIGMAFKGCCDIAADNIENDFGDSWMDRWSAAVDDHNKTREALREEQREHQAAEAELETVKDQLEKVREIRDEWMDEAKSTDEMLTEARTNYREASSKAAQLEAENIKLKAKLYDLMTA